MSMSSVEPDRHVLPRRPLPRPLELFGVIALKIALLMLIWWVAFASQPKPDTSPEAIAHLLVTWFLALGTGLSALWTLVANACTQHPVGAAFNPQTMRMEVTSFSEVFFNPVAQDKFVHTVSAGYVMGAMFVLSISAWYLLRGRNVDFAKRSMTVAASFGPHSSLTVWDASSSRGALQLMLMATAVLLPIMVLYTSWVYRVMRGRSRWNRCARRKAAGIESRLKSLPQIRSEEVRRHVVFLMDTWTGPGLRLRDPQCDVV
jgi:cytochrome bd-type quinol oxidase subunit 2